MTRVYAVILVVTVKGYESKLTLPLTTGHGMSALHVRQAVWLRGVSSQATFCIEDAKYFTLLLFKIVFFYLRLCSSARFNARFKRERETFWRTINDQFTLV